MADAPDAVMEEAAVPSAVPPAAAPPSVRLLFIVDITGSMSAELEACKGAMRGMVHLLTDNHAAGQLSFAVITFTESESGCYTSLFESTSAEAAQDYMNGIKLCRPPEEPGVTADGDDGPENHKAALARTTELDPSIPTIAFLITDAQPHIGLNPRDPYARDEFNFSTTADLELAYLESKYPNLLSPSDARDFYKCFQQTALAHFGSNLVLNAIIYNSRGLSAPQPCDKQLLFAGLAQQTGGMLMQPESRSAATMADGLLSVVKALMGRMRGGIVAPQHQQDEDMAQNRDSAGAAERLVGFKLIDLSGVHPDRSSEWEPAGVVDYGDTEELFNIAMDRMVAVCGKKWTKRAIGISAPAEQLQFVWRAARYISLCAKPPSSDPMAVAELDQSKDDELTKLLHLRQAVLAALPADQRGHMSITEQDLRQMGEEAAAWAASDAAAAGGAVSAISLTTVGEAMEDDAVWEDWLESVMKLLLGFPIHVQLPLDADGRPDFMDAWSALLICMGVDTISAAEFMQLIQDEAAAKGLSDKRDYNSFLVMPDPADKLASLVFRIASGTQALDYITSVAMGSQQGFLPNLHTGISAACLTKLLSHSTPLTDFQWSQVQQLAHTLCIRHTNAAKSVTAQLLAGQANPEDNISKLLLALLRLYRSSAPASAPGAAAGDGQLQAALGVVLQEWLGSLMQRFYGKQTPENNDMYYESVLKYIPVGAIFDSSHAGSGDQPAKKRVKAEAHEPGFDPLQHLSPLETTDASRVATDGPLPASIKPDWQVTVMQGLLGAHAGTPAHPVLGYFLLCAGRLLALLLPTLEATAVQAAVKAAAPPEGVALASALPGLTTALDGSWQQWKQAALEAMLLRFRTARYTCKAAEQLFTDDDGVPAVAVAPAKPQWETVQVPNCLSLAVGRLQEALTPQLKSYKQARLEEAKRQLLQVTANVLRQHAADAAKACAAIQEVQLLVRAGEAAEQTTAHNSGTASSSGPTARLLNVSYTLQRTDVPALLELLGVSCGEKLEQPAGSISPMQAEHEAGGVVSTGVVVPSLLRMLVLGPWCTQPAQVFKRSEMMQQLCAHFGSECDDVVAAIKGREVCNRTIGYNRHGHCANMPFPGADGWTEEYAAARLAAVAHKPRHQRVKVRTTIAAMKQYKAMAEWAMQAAGGDAEMAAAVAAVLSQEEDPKQHRRVLFQLQRMLGQSMS